MATSSYADPPPTIPAGQPVDAITGVIHSRRLASGVPMGGIGAGTFQLMTDGLFSSATYNNNWAYPLRDMRGCFAAVRARAGTRTVSRVLALSSPYGLPGMAAVDYEGLYPVANVAFKDGALPLAVSVRAFSPLVPHDVRNSCFPAAALVYRVTNTSGGEIDVSLALSWENTLGAGGTATTGPFDNRTGNTVAAVPDTEGFFALRFARPANAGASPDALLANNASGEMTLMAAPGRPQAIVTSASWNALESRPAWWDGFAADGAVHGDPASPSAGSTHPAGVICVRLTLKARESADLPFAVSWYTPHLNTTAGGDYGHYYETLWPGSYSAARGLLTEWHSLLALTEEWQQRILFSNLPRWMCRRLINAAAPMTTHSVFTRDETFAMLADTAGPEFQRANGVQQAPGPLPALRDFGVGARPSMPGSRLASPSRRATVTTLLNDLFPVLAARELRLVMARQNSDGGFPGTPVDIDRAIGPPRSGSPGAAEEALVLSSGPHLPLRSVEALDDTSEFLLQVGAYVFRTGDREFLHAYFPAIARTLALYMDNLAPDGLPVVAAGALTPSSASLFLAALHSGARLCRLSGSQAFLDAKLHPGLEGAIEAAGAARRQAENLALADRCDAARRTASAAMEKRFWNGTLYAERSSDGTEISALNQLSGVTAALRVGDDGTADVQQDALIPEPRVSAVLLSLHRLHDARSAALVAPLARAAASGAGVAAYTRTSDITASISSYAVLCIARGQADAAVSVMRRLDDARNNVLLSPWQAPSTFDAYTGAAPTGASADLVQAADWDVLAPLEGFSMDLSTGQMALSPQIPGNWRSLAAPVFAPTFWGRVEFRPTARGATTMLRVDRLIALPGAAPGGRLSGSAGLLVTRLRVAGPPPRPAGAPGMDAPVAHVSLGLTPLGVKTTRAPSGDYIVTFDTPVRLTAGDRLEVDVH